MNTSSIEQILVVLFPVLFPPLRLRGKKKETYHYVFFFLFAMQWLLYASMIKSFILAIVVANASTLFLLLVNPYWSLGIESYFTGEQRETMNNPIVRSCMTALLLLTAPPMITEATKLFVTIFFTSTAMLSDKEIISVYISWTAYHKVIAWLLLTAICILQFKHSINLEFDKFFFNRETCGDGKQNFSSLGATYFFGMYIVTAIIATFFSLDHGISMLW